MATKKAIELPEHHCGYEIAWVGKCKTPVEPEGSRCDEHELDCSSCGAPATHECSETGQFVCGAPLCDECKHLTWPEGHNGGVGFNALPLPDGCASTHIKICDQPDWSKVKK